MSCRSSGLMSRDISPSPNLLWSSASAVWYNGRLHLSLTYTINHWFAQSKMAKLTLGINIPSFVVSFLSLLVYAKRVWSTKEPDSTGESLHDAIKRCYKMMAFVLSSRTLRHTAWDINGADLNYITYCSSRQSGSNQSLPLYLSISFIWQPLLPLPLP